MKAGGILAKSAIILGMALPTHAQAPRNAVPTVAIPNGSYLRQCTDISVEAGRLTAVCPGSEGVQIRSSVDIKRCSGMDIGVSQGVLACLGEGEVVFAPKKPAPTDTVKSSVGIAPPVPAPSESYIILFSKASFAGRETPPITKPVVDLAAYDFHNTTASVLVRGAGSWQLCDKINFGGNCAIITKSEGSLVKYGLRNDVSSVRPVRTR